VLSPLFMEEACKSIHRFSRTRKDLELFIVLKQKQRVNWLVVKILEVVYSDGLQRVQPEEGTNGLGPWLEGTVNLSVSRKDAGSELRKALWPRTHFCMFLGRLATFEIAATIQLGSVSVFFLLLPGFSEAAMSGCQARCLALAHGATGLLEENKCNFSEHP